MNKKISLLLVLVLTLSVVLTACGPNTQAYLEKAKEVEKWEAIESTYKGNVKMKFSQTSIPEGETAEDVVPETVEAEMPIEFTSYAINPDKAYINYKIDMTNIKKTAPTPEEANEIFPEDVMEFEMYVDGTKVIMPKKLFEMQSPGMEIDILKGDEEYIAMDMGEMGLSGSDMAKFEKLGQDLAETFSKVYEAYKSDYDMKKSGDKFIYEFDTENGKKEIVSLIKYTKENSEVLIAAITPLMKEMDPSFNDETIAEMKKGLDEIKIEEVEAGVNEAMEMLKGSKIKGEVEFKENEVLQNIDMTLKFADFMNMEMNLKGTDKKAEVKAIEIPTSVKTITYAEYMDSMMKAMELPYAEKEILVIYNDNLENVEDDMIEFDTKPVIEDGRTLVPCRAFLEKLGLEVDYNEEEKVVTAKKGETTVVLTIDSDVALVNGKEVKLDKAARIEEDRTLVPLRFLAESFGLKVEYNELPTMIMINMMTPEYAAEMDKLVTE